MTLICDFCSTPNPVVGFPARDHSTQADIIMLKGDDAIQPELNSKGGWAACPECRDLILKGDRDGLAERSAAMSPHFKALPSFLRPTIKAEIRKLQDNFWANRNGDPLPIDAAAPNDDPTRPKDRTT